MITITCRECGAQVRTAPGETNRKKFCNNSCYWKWRSKWIRGKAHPMYGRKLSEETIAKIRTERQANSPTGPNNPHWKGGYYLDTRGYVMVNIANLPVAERALFAEMICRNSHRAIPEHRLIIARQLERPLSHLEVVHHRNGVKSDNRPENLEVTGNGIHNQSYSAVVRELRTLRRENERLRLLVPADH